MTLNKAKADWSYLKEDDEVSLVSPAASAIKETIPVVKSAIEAAKLLPSYRDHHDNPEKGAYYEQYEFMVYSNSDENRIKDFQEALSSDSKALWALHGGLGSERIVEALEDSQIKLPENKKIVIGFSGITSLHLYFLSKGWPCLHAQEAAYSKETHDIAKMPVNSEAKFNDVLDIITGKIKTLSYELEPINDFAKNPDNSITDSSITGGNLTIITNHVETPSAMNAEGKIVFIEGDPERQEKAEARFWGLVRNGSLKGAKALFIGEFINLQTDKINSDKARDILVKRMSKILEDNGINIPVVFSPDFGHGPKNHPLPLGAKTDLKLGKKATLTVSTSF